MAKLYKVEAPQRRKDAGWGMHLESREGVDGRWRGDVL